jgi:hypothetical protein
MKKNHILVIISLFLLYAISNYIWLSQNKAPLRNDEGFHLATNLRFVRAFVNPRDGILRDLICANTTHWPPLFYFTASLFNLIFGISYIVSVMTNMLFFGILIISVFLIGKKIYNSSVGILAAVIVSYYPIMYVHSRLFMLDFALTAMTAFSVYCLISTERFKNLRWSVIFGISAGLGMLTKWSYVFFILPLFLYEAIECFRDNKRKKFLHQIEPKNLLIIICISSLLSFIWLWYLICVTGNRYFSYLTGLFKWHAYPSLQGVFILHNKMLSPLFFILFICCLFIFYAKKSRYKFFFSIWYFIPMIALSFLTWREERFFMPILPCIALVSAGSLYYMKNLIFRNIIIVIILIAGTLQYFCLSFDYKREFRFMNEIKKRCNMSGGLYPYTEDWRHGDIAKSFSRHIYYDFKDYPLKVGIIYGANGEELIEIFGKRIMNYYFIRELLYSDVLCGGLITLSLNSLPFETKEFLASIPQTKGIIYISRINKWPDLKEIETFFKNHPWMIRDAGCNPAEDKRLIELVNSREKFLFIDRIGLPRGYYANLYLYKEEKRE